MDQKENRLVELVLSGRTEAFEPLVTPYRKLLLNLAYRLSRNAEEAKEIFRYLRSFDRKRSFKNWLLQIEMNVWRASARNSADEATLKGLAADLHPENPEAGLAHKELRGQILSCLDGLSPKEKEIFLLRDIEDMSIMETAQISRTSAIAVRVHLSRARQKIRECVKERFPELLERKQ
jgi:RNA polymerase sigma-70 factor (ECF subfamily)